MAEGKTGVVFKHTLESLFDNTLRARKLVTPALAAELEALGVDVYAPHEVPFETWRKVLTVCAHALSPAASQPEALCQLGQAFVEGYVTTVIGKTLLMNGRLIGPRRMILKIAETWATVNNIYMVKTVERGPRLVDVELNVQGEVTQYNRGALLGTLRALDAVDPRVDAEEFSNGTTRFTVSWTSP